MGKRGEAGGVISLELPLRSAADRAFSARTDLGQPVPSLENPVTDCPDGRDRSPQPRPPAAEDPCRTPWESLQPRYRAKLHFKPLPTSDEQEGQP
jgi:hypothetical protein